MTCRTLATGGSSAVAQTLHRVGVKSTLAVASAVSFRPSHLFAVLFAVLADKHHPAAVAGVFFSARASTTRRFQVLVALYVICPFRNGSLRARRVIVAT